MLMLSRVLTPGLLSSSLSWPLLKDVYIVPHVLLQVVELISGGSQIAVNNENKMHYLNLLAQYRLASQVRDEVEHFLKGEQTSTAAACHCLCQIL